jgi:hypothetical protein
MYKIKNKIYSEARFVDNNTSMDVTEQIVKELEEMGSAFIKARAELKELEKFAKTSFDGLQSQIENIKKQAQGVIDTCERLENL